MSTAEEDLEYAVKELRQAFLHAGGKPDDPEDLNNIYFLVGYATAAIEWTPSLVRQIEHWKRAANHKRRNKR